MVIAEQQTAIRITIGGSHHAAAFRKMSSAYSESIAVEGNPREYSSARR